MRLLDRYIAREMIAPFAIAFLILTFILVLPVIIAIAEHLVATGLPWPVMLELMSTLFPPVLALTIPMAFLIAVLVALSRLSADRELLVMMACGASPYQLLRPLLVVAALCWAASSWVMLEAIPQASLRYRALMLQIAADRAETEVRARQFFEVFPDLVLYVRDAPAAGGWVDVFAAHTSGPGASDVYVAARGRLVVDAAHRRVEMTLEDGVRHSTVEDDPSAYGRTHFERVVISLDPNQVFRALDPQAGRELSIAQLRERRAGRLAAGQPTYNETIEMHRRFSVPVACFVFALVGAGLGLTNRSDGKLGSFIVGILIIFGYYTIMYTAHAAAKGGAIPAWSAMWVPNAAIGAIGAHLVWRRAHYVDTPVRIGRGLLERAFRQRHPAAAAFGQSSDAGTWARPPEGRFPRPRLLDVYVMQLYLRVLATAGGGLLGLYYLSTFMDRSDKWFKGQISLGQIAVYLAWSTPQFVFYVLAMAVLLATLVTMALLAKRSELIAMHACGVSLYRNATPLIALAAASGLLLFAIQEWVLPATNRHAAFLQHVINGNPPQTFDVVSNRKWLLGLHDEIYHYDYFDPARRELHRLSIFEFAPGGGLSSHAYATTATHLADATDAAADRWQAGSGWRRDFAAHDTSTFSGFDGRVIRLAPAQYFVTAAPEPDRMQLGELRAYVQNLLAKGYNVVEYQVALHRKVAFPFVTVIMTLVAIPFAVTIGTRGALNGVAAGVALGLAYWTLTSVSAALGVAGVLPPVVAAWSPNLLFASAAAYLVLNVRT